MDDGNSRMLQLGRDPGLTLQSTGEFRDSKPFAYHLDRDRAVKHPVGGAPHLAHGTVAQQLLQDVPPGEFGPSLHPGPPLWSRSAQSAHTARSIPSGTTPHPYSKRHRRVSPPCSENGVLPWGGGETCPACHRGESSSATGVRTPLPTPACCSS